MGNAKNKKVSKKRKASNTCRTSLDQKENTPKTEKTRNKKSNPDDCIEMSKQLLLKKKNLRSQRRSSSKPERVCPNGKPIPSLEELEKMFEESDEDDQTPKSHPTTSTPEKRAPTTTSEKNLLSPTTINKISERLISSIQQQKLPDPSEVLEATSLLREKSPPPPPIIPPKKKKKTEIPYIVGCKDRPQVIRKPNTNFCKGDDDYGVEASSDDPEEMPAKRAKKSKIPKYSKSIFNAHSDEIAERLAKYDAGDLSDASSDSNKTIKYEPTIVQNQRPQSFSPLPSTSRDTETFQRNDELFNVSLQEIQRTKDISKKNDELTDESLKEINTTKEKHDIEMATSTLKKKDDITTDENLTTITLDDSNFSTFKGTDEEVQIIDIPYDTIAIHDVCERKARKPKTNYTIDDSDIELIDPAGILVIKSEDKPEIIDIPNDDDCMIVPNSDTVNNHNNYLNEAIVIDDEYSNINMEFDSYITEPIEIIDVDDVIAENKSILDKWKNSQELSKINTVVDVPTTYRNVTAVQPIVTSSTTEQTTSTHSTSLQASVTPSTSLQASVTPSTTLQASISPGTTLQASITPSSTLQANVAQSTAALPTTSAGNPVITSMSNAKNSRQHSIANVSLDMAFQRIVCEFFADLKAKRPQNNTGTHSMSIGDEPGQFARTVSDLVKSLPSANRSKKSSQKTYNIECRVDLNKFPSDSGTTSTNMPPAKPASPIPQRNLGDCPICLDPISSNTGIASTICGHVFCLSCIKASIKSSGKKCPTCRKSLKGVGYHQLYL